MNNNEQNNAEGNALVSRLLNVLASEVLLTVEKRLNDLLTRQSNQLALLQDRLDRLVEEVDPLLNQDLNARVTQLENVSDPDLVTVRTTMTALKDKVGTMDRSLDTMERTLTSVEHDLSELQSTVSDLPDNDEVRTMVDDAIEAADLISKDDARKLIEEVIIEQELCERGRVREIVREEAFDTVRAGLRDILDGGRI